MSPLPCLNPYTLHINLYDLVFLGTIFIGLTFILQLWFTKRTNQTANRFLSLALAIVVLWIAWVLGVDIRLGTYFPRWSWLPLQFSLALGPLIYFYVLKITRPEYKLRWKDLLHFSPLLLQQGILILEIKESIKTGTATYDTLTFYYVNPILQVLAFFSVAIYIYYSFKLIERFYRRLKFNDLSDRYRYELRWLHNLLVGFALLWLLWIPFTAIDYFYYHYQLGIHAYYPLILLLAVLFIWIAIVSYLRLEASLPADVPSLFKPSPPAELKEKGIWLKKVVKANQYYQDPELSLVSLAEKLELTTHELSRIINTALKKSFNDFINEYRVAEVIKRMQDPAYDGITLLGIAYDSGFNSKSTFNLIFKKMTGKTPVEYKTDLRKEFLSYNLGRHQQFAGVISNREATPKWSHEKLNRNYMIRNYIKTSYRSLLKNKGFTILNILGLSIGLATCLLIVFYVMDEQSYDRYNTKADRVYRVNVDVKFNGNANSYAAVPAPMAAALKSELPEVEDAMRFHQAAFTQTGKYYIKKGNVNILENKVVYADARLFKLFTLPVIDGSPATALTAPHSAVITESTAKKYFNKTNVVGQTLVINDTINYKVTAIIKDIPTQSHFNYNVFLSAATLPDSRIQSWMGGGWNTYVLARQGVMQQKLEADINGVAKKHLSGLPAGFSIKFDLIPLTNIHLQSDRQQELGPNGSIQYVYIFSVIALFILLIACVNFMNLSTARSSNRAKEVGVRKVLGSSRKYLVAQFLTESTLVSLFSTLLAALLAWLLMPLFNQMAGKELTITLSSLLWLAPLLLGIAVVIGFLAGAYPAFFLSAFEPIAVLKGKIAAGFKGGFLRSFLVVFQFAISVFLIISTLVMYKQLNYIHSKNVGYNRNQVLVIGHTDVMGNKAKILNQDIKQLRGVVSTTMTSYLPTALSRNTTALFAHLPIDLKEDILTEFWPVDEDYISTLDMKLVSGRNFSREMATDTSAIIVNEAYIKALGVKDPLGKTVYRDTYGVQPYHIIGIMKDFHFNSLRDKISPVVFYKAGDNGAISVRVNTANLPELISQIKKKWKDLSPNQEFTYSFMDEDFDAAYRAEQRVGTLFISFSTLAILIACLGLFGLAAFAAEQRNKEIGVRKVLGATVSGIVGMLSADFIKLVLVSILIASPLAWYVMNKWLQGFAYRIQIEWWIVAAAGSLALLIAFITISFQSVRAALANPVKSLRSE
ncbi:MAG: FtsX-like permease family protein [Mucilaginibacter sp.]|nr:FtsX-like permease family protein [Mucilaginibacter sp.]